MQNNCSLYIFHRDLRLHDNTALLEALSSSKEVIPAFIFDPIQLVNNPYRGEFLIQFMRNSLFELDSELRELGSKLYFFYGDTLSVVESLIETKKIDAIFFNRDYTPFSKIRDSGISKLCSKKGVRCSAFQDYLLNPTGSILKGDGTPYSVYTPFAKRSRKESVIFPKRNTNRNYYSGSLKNTIELDSVLKKNGLPLFRQGGRKEAKNILRRIGGFSAYSEERDFPALEKTTGLSPHLKFGTVSAREVYHVVAKNLGKDHILINELYWRDFFTHVADHFPHVFKGAFNKRYQSINWRNDESEFTRWCNGETGFPIVDAGMRQLNATGFMHNRVRMIVASFLTKDLHIDWRWGEKYFAQKLIDYDPAVNNGNWQWAASTGCDAQPYFRVFNPWLQQVKFDHNALYIKKWIPELSEVPPSMIHKLSAEQKGIGRYPPAMIDHDCAKEIAISLFKENR